MDEVLLEAAFGHLRGHTSGILRFDEHHRPIKVVFAPNGRIVAPVMVAMIEAADTVLFLPDESEDSMQIQVTLTPFEEEGEGGALADRWRIYHGDPQDVHWAYLFVDAARYESAVIDGDGLMRENPLSDDEARFCKAINDGRREDLHRIVRSAAGLTIDDPLLVGVDPFGFDVRGRFKVYRVVAPAPLATIDDAQAAFDQLALESAEHTASAD
jgi:hypothetical protein